MAHPGGDEYYDEGGRNDYEMDDHGSGAFGRPAPQPPVGGATGGHLEVEGAGADRLYNRASSLRGQRRTLAQANLEVCPFCPFFDSIFSLC